MIQAFLFSLASFFIPPLILVRTLRGKLPWLLILHVALLGVLFSIGYNLFGFGWRLYATAQLLSFSILYFSSRYLPPATRPIAFKRSLLFFLVAFLLSGDLALIFSKNGWGQAGESVYMRPPFQSDSMRNVVVIEALRRHGGAPWLPASAFAYQLFWHHLAGGVLFPFHAPTLFPAVSGITLATSVLFFFLMLSSLFSSRPSLLRRRWPLLVISVLLFVHADLFQMLFTWFTTKGLGIELDWSAQHGFFRNFSPKAVVLSSPQHALCFALIACSLSVRSWHRFVLVVFAYLSSPILSVFFYGPYFGMEWVLSSNRKRDAAISFFVLAAALLSYWLVFNVSPLEIFFRLTQTRKEWALSEPGAWLILPFAWLASIGVPGLLATLWSFSPKWEWAKKWMVLTSALVFLLACDSEVRRHYSLILSLVVPFFLVQHWPKQWNRVQLSWVGSMLALAGIGHAYFLYCYLGKASHIDPTLPWQDYFSINQYIRKHLPGEPILAAANPHHMGLDMPVVMEATPSLSLREHAYIHCRVTPRQKELLQSMSYSEDVVAVGKELGYRWVLWGPVEEKTWGVKIRSRFLGSPVYVRGAVGIYQMTDRFLEQAKKDARQEPKPSFAFAKKFEDWEFDREAKTLYEQAYSRDPREVAPLLGLARLYLKNKNSLFAHEFLRVAIEKNSTNSEARFLMGNVLRLMKKPDEALGFYRQALQLDPTQERYYRTLITVSSELGRRGDSEKILTDGLSSAETKEGLKLDLALLLQEKRNIRGYRALLEKLAQTSKDASVRGQACQLLGQELERENKNQEARDWYRKAISYVGDTISLHIALGRIAIRNNEKDWAIANFKWVLEQQRENEVAREALKYLGAMPRW